MKSNLILFLVILQIILLVNNLPADSYLIKEASGFDNQVQNYNKDFGINLRNLFLNLIAIKQIGIVSAASATEQCCLQNNNGAICQAYSSDVISQACSGSNIVQTKCSDTSVCQLGTCLDSIEGTCSTNAPRGKCESNQGKWFNDPNANIPECKKGCCVLGSNVQYTTETQCSKISASSGFDKDFKQVSNELECLAMKETVATGACVFSSSASDSENSCRFTTASDCFASKGEFHENTLCSASSLGSNCKAQDHVSCVLGKDEIYWFDSCGNQENIYSSDKNASYNNGKILSKEQSCNPSSSNAGSLTCGNCNYLLGSSCSDSALKGVQGSNVICKDLSCKASAATGNVPRENGESWCSYDGTIGNGKDTVGSRHWRESCIDGEVQSDGCADYRGEICVQSDVDVGGSKTLSNAACVVNRASQCISYNKDKDNMQKNCLQNSQCQLTQVNVDKGFKFEVCTGKYPGGFDLTGSTDRTTQSASQICSMANQKCTVIYQKGLTGGWKCIANCKCETKKFSQEMNNLCVALGDCGTYVNYEGVGTNNIKVKGAPKVSWQDYVKYATPVAGQKAEPDNISEIAKQIGLGGNAKSSNGNNSQGSNILGVVGTVGALGIGALTVAYISKNGFNLPPGLTTPASIGNYFFGKTPKISPYGTPVYSDAAMTQPVYVDSAFAPYLNGITGIGVGALVGGLVAKAFGLQGEAATAVVVAGAIAGGYAGFTGATFLGLKGFAAFGLYGLIAAIVVAIVMKILGVGKIKKVIVKFTCLPWTPPTGSSNCEKCNSDPLKPCTSYRCSSLGAGCEIVNANSETPTCISTVNDGRAPDITPGNISANFTFVNKSDAGVQVRNNDGSCIEAFTPVLFSLQTDERAECKYSFSSGTSFDEMEEYTAESSYFVMNHTFGFAAPSIESLQALGIDITGDVKEQLGNLRMHVKCSDVNGNKNVKDYVVDLCVSSGPDKTAPRIVATTPENGAKIKKDASTQDLNIYLNEPATCKYDTISGKNYGNMSNEMTCNTDVNDADNLGWQCGTTLNNLVNDENKFFIKCADQPWLIGSENESQRNPNSDDYIYVLNGTKENLQIVSSAPNGTQDFGVEPKTVEFEVRTSEGSDNGKAECSYSFTGYDNMIQFLNTFSTTSTQPGLNLLAGDYNVYIKCKDEAGNEALGNIIFGLKLDTAPPKVTRVFGDGEIKIVTDEDAQCYYNFNNCNFNLENGTLMTTGLGKEHTADLIQGKIYSIRCKDVWGNTNPSCAIKLISGAI